VNGASVTTICATGTPAWIAWAIPIEAAMAIVRWIGTMIVAQHVRRVHAF
jgi:AGZA family xanthine/uracil permease-like MFS transporter